MTPPALIIAGGAVIAVGGIVAFHQVNILLLRVLLCSGNGLSPPRAPIADSRPFRSWSMNLTSHPNWRHLSKIGWNGADPRGAVLLRRSPSAMKAICRRLPQELHMRPLRSRWTLSQFLSGSLQSILGYRETHSVVAAIPMPNTTPSCLNRQVDLLLCHTLVLT
jgi:hypothetical protein